MDSNNSNKFVNLSHVLLQEILNHLEDNIDRVIMTFVCKKWFAEREYYLTFNTKSVPVTSIETFKHKQILSSHLKQMEYSLNRKKKCTAMIVKDADEGSIYSWLNIDYFVLVGQPIPDNVYLVQFGDGVNVPLESLNIHENANITWMRLPPSFNYPLSAKALPKNLKSLFCGKSFNQPIRKGDLPETLEELSIGYDFYYSLQPDTLPKSLTNLSLGHHYICELLPNVLTENITTVTNIPLTYLHMLPPTVTTVRLIGLNGQTLKTGSIPSTVTDLDFGTLMNQPLEVGMIPFGVTKLNLNRMLQVNDPVMGTIPESVIEIDFSSLNKPVPIGFIPSKVEKIEFSILFQSPLESITTIEYTYGYGTLCRRVSDDHFLLLGEKLKSKITDHSMLIDSLIEFEDKKMIWSR
ncbi:hypothetical protein PPL_07145 [Heterostelium album PN500]|uniref:COI1 F-box domain-containing protein n=1 Tax=Heterostelium pallidum (strain ATCC 26659 / Pp 5 / PN500) TaxID=670386 RepID=D3BEI3_HETP5|nr:hypothetical protein PPL_07145 [Heterostelium album PN500]EFA80314.1 hypothetical protein PPL_07145 [Heterostelium album PN500]|eukprot:XP_020432434.1 hypothetical protein PPL_07145 [Heterostelium album PN500]